MACSAILVLDLKGRVLLARDYRGDIPLKQADRFIQKVGGCPASAACRPGICMLHRLAGMTPWARLHMQVQELEDANRLTPVIHDDGVSYLYVQVRRSAAPEHCSICALHCCKHIQAHLFRHPVSRELLLHGGCSTRTCTCWRCAAPT